MQHCQIATFHSTSYSNRAWVASLKRDGPGASTASMGCPSRLKSVGGRNHAATFDKDPHMATTTVLQISRKLNAPTKTIASPAMDAPAPPAAKTTKTKQTQLIELLRRDAGGSIDELATSLGWLPHTTRAALTGLRKKGHNVSKTKVDDVTRYSIAAAASEARA